ncbi:hypothetical protein D6D18_01248 [Aureobasidium pullulans]|nr:hypothetical protein D6D18_01248 [Aureobasidium pullulans]
MRRRRALYSSSSDQPWYQNSSDAQRAANSGPTANLVASDSSGTGQRYTTIYLTRTQYTTFVYSNSHSSQSSKSAISSSSSQNTSSSKSYPRVTSTSSWSSAFTYQPTTFSTTTTARVTTHSTTTVKTIVYVTSTRTVPADADSPVPTSTTQDITSTASKTHSSAATSSIGAVAGGGGHGSLLVSPKGSSKHSAAIAGGMTGSLAGIALIGLLFLFLFRRRKRRPPYHEKHEAAAEPRMSSSSQALPSAIAGAGAPRHSDRSIVPQRSPSGRPPVIDHNLIHMDLNHWDRPLAHEDPHPRHDGSPLRLMNPDPTPTPPIILTASSSVSPENNPHRFLQRQRSALAAALLSVKRSFSSQDVVPRHASEESHTHTSAHPSAHPSPLHIQDKSNKLTMPSEVILAGASATESRPMSSQSAMSNNTIIRHHAPDDPFVSSPAVTSPLPGCLQPGHNDGIARRDFLAPPPLRTRVPVPCTPTQHGAVSPLTRSNSDCSTRFESLSSPTRSEVSSVSVRSGPFDLASASVVDGDVGREGERVILQRNGAERVVLQRDGADRVILQREQREQTPNWEVHVYPGT